jgi:hypothetical protein
VAGHPGKVAVSFLNSSWKWHRLHPLLNSLSLWERVRERALRLAAILNYAPLPRPFPQREKGDR